MQSLIRHAYNRAKDILTTHREKLTEIAEYLMVHETVEGEALKRLFDGHSPQEPVPAELKPEPSPSLPPAGMPVPPQPSPAMPILHDVTRTDDVESG